MTMGHVYGVLGAAIAIILANIGSAIGVSRAGQMAGGIMSKDPSKFITTLVLQLLPASQGLYGLVTAFMAMTRLGLFGGSWVAGFTTSDGLSMLFLCLPVGIIGLISAIMQGNVCMSSMEMCIKQEGQFGKGIVMAVLVEVFAIFGLVLSLMGVMMIQPSGIASGEPIVNQAISMLSLLA